MADFTSGVLVANLGHNPTRWWKRVTEYLGLAPREQDGEFLESLPLTAYNAVTELEVRAAERLVAEALARGSQDNAAAAAPDIQTDENL